MASPYAFLVEGRDDLYVVEALWRVHQQRDFPCAIEEREGIDRLLADLRVRIKPQDSDLALERLGIVVDADADAAPGSARWRSPRDTLIRAGYPIVPAAPAPGGTIIDQPGRPVVGIWVMPDNTGAGMLEDLIRSLIPANDLLLGRAQDCLNGIPAEQRRFPAHHHGKALIHTWLAWQETPGRPYGLAIRARYLDANAPNALALVGWLRRLFDA